MNLVAFEYMMLAILFLAMPIHGLWEHGRLRAALKAGAPNVRLRTYTKTMIVEWVLFSAAVGYWLYAGRGLTVLGFGFRPGWGWWTGATLVAGAFVLLAVQTKSLLRNREKLAELSEQHAHLEDFIPSNEREARWWTALSITAGICEELLYRGFLIAVLAVPLGTWLAVLLSSVAFGLGHAYQGAGGILKTGALGLAVAGLYILTGSLWIPILLHIVIDINSGYAVRRAFQSSKTSAGCSPTEFGGLA